MASAALPNSVGTLAAKQPIPFRQNELDRPGFSVNLTARRETNGKWSNRNSIRKLFPHSDLAEIAGHGAQLAFNIGDVETLRADWQAIASFKQTRAASSQTETRHPDHSVTQTPKTHPTPNITE